MLAEDTVNSSDSPNAFTIGNPSIYDPDLAEATAQGGTIKKIGRREGYSGGWVWRTSEDAQAFADQLGSLASGQWAVYGLKLPSGWDTDVDPARGDDGQYHLINDALLIGRLRETLMYRPGSYMIESTPGTHDDQVLDILKTVGALEVTYLARGFISAWLSEDALRALEAHSATLVLHRKTEHQFH